MRGLWVAFAIACSMPPEPSGPAARAEVVAPPLPEPSEREAPPRAPLDPSSPCGRAERCCVEFAAVTPHVRAEVACAEPAEVAELADGAARCERMLIGWRAALERHADAEVPEACLSARRR
mgnify:CR=1 FL=1